MWRGYNNAEPPIGYPGFEETTMDERYLETIPEVESLYSRPSSVVAPLPELRLRSVPPANDSDLISSAGSEASAQTPSASQGQMHRQEEYTAQRVPGPGDVSPLSSQSSFIPAEGMSPLVSPVESTFDVSARPPQPEPQFQSQIPRRRSPPGLSPQEATAESSAESTPRRTVHDRKKEETRWDEYSGEPTTSEAGKPSAVRPGQPPLEVQHPQLKERTKQILAGLREREAARKATWGRLPPPVEDPLDNPVQRPPWKGASGRVALVEPVKNTPDARAGPLLPPDRSLRRMRPAPLQILSQKLDRPTGTAANPLSSQTTPSSAVSATPFEEEGVRPVAPLKLKKNSPLVRSPVPVDHRAMLQSPFQSPQPTAMTVHGGSQTVPTESKTEKPTDGADSPTLPSASSFVRPPERQPSEESLRQPTAGLEHEPPSQLGRATYMTTLDESPRSTIRADVESRHTQSSPVSSVAPASVSIGVRKKPVSFAPSYSHTPYSNIEATMSNSSVLSRKPISTEKRRAVSMMTTTSASGRKSLPPTPQELQANDKVSVLEARLEDLARRKRNINKIIKELADGLKRNAIVYEARKRKEIEKMTINLNLELDEITNEEHEVGLRLHRVHKRRDKDDNYEHPTGLWIKRVTS